MKIIASVTIALLFVLFSISAYSNLQDAIAERLQPVGSICKAGDECASSSATTDESAPRDAVSIYQSGCAACHLSGVGGAPKSGDVAQWNERLTKGIETLYSNALNGIGAMPAKGLCTDCSDDDIRAVVDYILEQSK